MWNIESHRVESLLGLRCSKLGTFLNQQSQLHKLDASWKTPVLITVTALEDSCPYTLKQVTPVQKSAPERHKV